MINRKGGFQLPLGRWLPILVELLGLAAVIIGVCLIWLPLGIIVGGIIAVFIAQGLRRDITP
mgnify:CR=1 FL=1